MQTEIKITLTDEDTKAGMTVAEAVAKVFPGAPADFFPEPPGTVELDATVLGSVLDRVAEAAVSSDEVFDAPQEPESDTLKPDIAENSAEAVLSEPTSLVAEVDIDSVGSPWDVEVCSSNKKFYASGSTKGRWQKRKGVDQDVYEEKTRRLAEELRTAPAAEPEPAQVVADAPLVTVPEIEAPTAVVATAPTAGNLPVGWTDFLKAMTAASVPYTDVEASLAEFGVEEIAELATNNAARDAIAAKHGMVSQVAS